MGSFSFWHGFVPDLGRPWLHNYFAGVDPFLVEDLVRLPVPVGVLSDERRSHPARHLLASHGVEGQLPSVEAIVDQAKGPDTDGLMVVDLIVNNTDGAVLAASARGPSASASQ